MYIRLSTVKILTKKQSCQKTYSQELGGWLQLPRAAKWIK